MHGFTITLNIYEVCFITRFHEKHR